MNEIEGIVGLILNGFKRHPVGMGLPAIATLGWVAWFTFRREFELVKKGIRIIVVGVSVSFGTIAFALLFSLGGVGGGTMSPLLNIVIILAVVCSVLAYYGLIFVLIRVAVLHDRMKIVGDGREEQG